MRTLTKAEEKAIVKEAKTLLKEPGNWITGMIVRDENDQPVPAYDFHNRPIAQYCVEGAVNQAALNVLGEKKAAMLGVQEESRYMTETLGLNEIAHALYPEWQTALEVNDHIEGSRLNVSGHTAVLNILDTKLKSLTARAKGVMAGSRS
jgi:hypothetical protein